jgi:hypothetical protein
MDVTYPPPVDQLLSLGNPDHAEDDVEYRALGISEEHVPVLIQMMRDERLNWVLQELGEDEAPFWAPVHAWRALGELRAGAAVPAMLAHLADYPDDEWITEEIPEVLAKVGAPALQPTREAFVRATLVAVGRVWYFASRSAGTPPGYARRRTASIILIERSVP